MFTTNVYLQYPYTWGDNYFNLALINFASMNNQIPCNTFILFFPHHFRPLRVYGSANQVGRCSHVGGAW